MLDVGYALLLRGAEDEAERDELRSTINRPVLGAAGIAGAVVDEDLPDWATDYMPKWWGGHEQAAYDAQQGGRVEGTR